MYLDAHDIHAHFDGKFSLWTIRQWMSSGVIESRKIGNKRLATRSALEKYIQGCKLSTNEIQEQYERATRKKAEMQIDVRGKSVKEILNAI